MTHSQREIIFSEINKALSDAPRWGSISLTIHFSDGDVTHIDRDRTEEVRIGPARGDTRGAACGGSGEASGKVGGGAPG